jgi:hypothetical protein
MRKEEPVNFLSQMLPGFRHVRAPLISGYIWLVVAWLLLSDELPRKHDSPVYRRIYELGEAAGPIALALVASVGAYLIGSLAQAALSALADEASSLWRNRFRRHWYTKLPQVLPVEMLLAPPLLDSDSVGWIEGNRQTKARLRSLANMQLNECQKVLTEAEEEAEGKVTQGLYAAGSNLEREDIQVAVELEFPTKGEPLLKSLVVKGRATKAPEELEKNLELPSFSAARNVFEEKGAIKTILMEETQQAGSEVERLYSEAELRFAVALPLAALIVVLWAQSGDWWWLALLIVPVALLLHALVLNKQGGLELVEALRSREQADLDKILPSLGRYRDRATSIAGALTSHSGWPSLAVELDKKEQVPVSGDF